ncbi:Cytochrome b561 and DOMON domain-containing protein At5g35735 [Euphorbia peplus]|nr:Cytochrome b561 and DOMON domain-containing protein At5g35735 [Euphorbia peplus]
MNLLGLILGSYVKLCLGLYYFRAFWRWATYAIGVAGWATGMKLGHQSLSLTHSSHRIIGILIFCFGTMDICGCGCSELVTLILSIVNIYQGLHILQPDPKWKKIYTGILIFFGCLFVLLEIITGFIQARISGSCSPNLIVTRSANANGEVRNDDESAAV